MHGVEETNLGQAGVPLTALVVDDSGTLRSTVKKFLMETGSMDRIVEAADGLEAMKALKTDSIDIIVCDVVMPGCDGVEFLKMKSEHPEYDDIPVIMLTSEGACEAVVTCLEAGATDHIAKPVQKDEFVARLKVHCGLKQRQQELIRVRDQLSDSRSFLDNIINSMIDGLIVLDKDENVVQCNETILALLGFESADGIIGTPIRDFISEDDLLRMVSFSELLRKGPVSGMVVRFSHQNGEQVVMSVSASTIQGYMAETASSILLMRNIQEAQTILAYESRELAEEKEASSQFAVLHFQLHELNRRLEEQSFHDSLTGLWNRRYLYQAIPRYVADIHRTYYGKTFEKGESDCVAFVMLDLDHFKQVNDTYGHEAGDQVLCETARRLEETSRTSDIVIRWGGEEFLVIGRNTNHCAAKQLANRIQASFRKSPFEIGGGRELDITCSVGLACYPLVPEKCEALSWEDVLAVADQGLYASKLSGRDQWVGLGGTEKTTIDDFRERLGESVRELVTSGELEVDCEKGEPEDLEWND